MATIVISGRFRGLKLFESPDSSIRPTKAIVRKSVFQRLEPWTGLEVCDLFAGIGSLGIEALSRGAATVDFVDRDAVAGQLIKRNLAKAATEDRANVIQLDVEQFLANCRSSYDVIMADPSYGAYEWADLLNLVAELLKENGKFVMELPTYSVVPDDVDTRQYGKTKVCIWQKQK
ncbi:RsmD family RNA methyltransferase [Candidatus Neomarinimicrobiota bacterium]